MENIKAPNKEGIRKSVQYYGVANVFLTSLPSSAANRILRDVLDAFLLDEAKHEELLFIMNKHISSPKKYLANIEANSSFKSKELPKEKVVKQKTEPSSISINSNSFDMENL